MRIQFPVPYFCQWDNLLHRSGSCNLTSAAMECNYFGVSTTPDELLQYADDHGLDRHSPYDIKYIMEKHGIKDQFSATSKWHDIKEHIKNKLPVILHGYFTPSGHIMVLHGIDEEKGLFLMNDPAGKWNQKLNGSYNGWISGQDQWYNSRIVREVVGPDGDCWSHRCSKA